MDNQQQQRTTSGSSIHTYHCICSTLILATPYLLEELPKRSAPAQDQAIILPPTPTESSASTSQQFALHNVVTDRKGVVIRREDGFEKRNLLRCSRCRLVVGYRLDESSSPESSPVFLLLGGLVNTEDMKTGRRPQEPVWATEKA